jgi:tetratricopeptide (TPR) repeat protein
VPTFFAGLLAFLLVAGAASVRRQAAPPVARDLAAARAALADAGGRPEAAVSLAEKALAFAGDSPNYQAEAHFLLGLATARLAEAGPAELTAERRKTALGHLRQAEALGVPDRDRPSLCYALGRLLYQVGDWRRAAGYLREGLPHGADRPADGYGMLAQAYLRLPAPDLDAALRANQKQEEYGRDEKTWAEARLVRGEILLGLGKYADAVKVLERVGPAAPARVRLRARVLQARACEKAGLWARAAPLWQGLLKTPDQVPGGRAPILYTLGLCHLQADPPNAGAARKAWQQAAAEGGEEGQAAALRLAELDVAGAGPDLAAAVDHLRLAVDRLGGPADYQNKLVSLEKAREVFEAALRAALEAQDFDRAEQLAGLYARVAAPGAAEERFAAAAEALARQTEVKAARLPPGAEATVKAQLARAQWRKAAGAAERAVEGPGGPRPDGLWRAAHGYRKAGDNDRAVKALERLVAMPAPPERQAEAWFTLAEARRELGREGEARRAYLECTNFSGSPFSYRARYRLAVAARAQHRPEEAESLLTQNLQIMAGHMDREAYQQSLYELANLLYDEKKFDLAEVRFAEAVANYPGYAGTLAARHRLGECYRELAAQEGKRLAEVLAPGGGAGRQDKEAYYVQKRLGWLAKAVDVYQKLRDDLRVLAADRRLSDEEARLLRSASFCLAESELDSNHFREALRLYLDLVRAYPRQYDGAVALSYVGRCLNLMKSDVDRDKARELRAQVKAAAKQVRQDLTGDHPAVPDSDFAPGVTRADYLRWLGQFDAWVEEGWLAQAQE